MTDYLKIWTDGLLVRENADRRNLDAMIRQMDRIAVDLQLRAGAPLASFAVRLAAASMGSVDALTTAAMFIRDGIVDPDGEELLQAQPAVAHKMFALAARRGCPSAMAALAFDFHGGIGCSPNRRAAIQLWRRAAQQGSVVAATNLGIEYLEKGKWVAAKRYFAMAVDMGDAEAAVGYAKSCIGAGKRRAGLVEAEGVLKRALRKSSKSWSEAGREEGEELLAKVREQLRKPAPAPQR